MKYHLWDTEAGSYIGQYSDENVALATVQSLIDRYGTGFADELSLGREEDDGTVLSPLTSAELVARLEGQQQHGQDRNGRIIDSGRRTSAGTGIASAVGRPAPRDRE
jgi:hypothetical protein